MATKYASLKGVIPEQVTERDALVTEFIEAFRGESFDALTVRYNAADRKAGALASRVKRNKARMDALEILTRGALAALNMERATLNGFTWSEGCEPYPSCDDPAAIIQYFTEHQMTDMLTLKASELASRLKMFVKEEALNNELTIEDVPDPVTGAIVQVVRSRIPGVKVYLKTSLSRRKSDDSK